MSKNLKNKKQSILHRDLFRLDFDTKVIKKGLNKEIFRLELTQEKKEFLRKILEKELFNIKIGPESKKAIKNFFINKKLFELNFPSKKITSEKLPAAELSEIKGNFGEITYSAVSISAPAGKPRKECEHKNISLTLSSPEDSELLSEGGINLLRRKRIISLTKQAKEQAALLTEEDLANLLCTSLSTIKREIANLRKENIFVPTRGKVLDIGQGVKHKADIVDLYLQGEDEKNIEEKTGHPPEKISQHLNNFAEVIKYSTDGESEEAIYRLCSIPKSLIKAYQGIYQKFAGSESGRMRLEVILGRKEPLLQKIETNSQKKDEK